MAKLFKSDKNKQQASVNNTVQRQKNEHQNWQDNSADALQMRSFQASIDNSEEVTQMMAFDAAAQKNEVVQLQKDNTVNNTGLPDNLKSGMEQMSGLPMDDVQVHYNSPMPEQVQAHAYAQGTDIHLGPGQEQHLPHELAHVVQQKEGKVKPTMQMKGVDVNDDSTLEKEADAMGNKALQSTAQNNQKEVKQPVQNSTTVQREEDEQVPQPADKLTEIFNKFTGMRYLNESEEIEIIEDVFNAVKGIDDAEERKKLHQQFEPKIKELTDKWIGLTASNKEFLDGVILHRYIPATLGGQRRRFTAWLDYQVSEEAAGSWFFGVGAEDYTTLIENGYKKLSWDEKTQVGQQLITAGAIDKDVLHNIGKDPAYRGGSLNFDKFAAVVRKVKPNEKLTALMSSANPVEGDKTFESNTSEDISTGGTIGSIANTAAGGILSLVAKFKGGVEALKGGMETVNALSVVNCVTTLTGVVGALSGGKEVSDTDKALMAAGAAVDTLKSVADACLQFATGDTATLAKDASGFSTTMFQLSGVLSIISGGIKVGKGIKDILEANNTLSKLQGLESRMQEKSFAHAFDLAKTAQGNKRVQAVGSIVSGAASIAGGIGMLAAMSNPIGWIFLVSGGVIAGGFALYGKWKKYKDKQKFIERLYNTENKKPADAPIENRDDTIKEWIQMLGFTKEDDLYNTYTTNLAEQILSKAKAGDKTSIDFLSSIFGKDNMTKDELSKLKVSEVAKKVVNG